MPAPSESQGRGELPKESSAVNSRVPDLAWPWEVWAALGDLKGEERPERLGSAGAEPPVCQGEGRTRGDPAEGGLVPPNSRWNPRVMVVGVAQRTLRGSAGINYAFTRSRCGYWH